MEAAHPAVDIIPPVLQAAVTGATMPATAMAVGAGAQPALTAAGAVMPATAMAVGALLRAAAVTITTPAAVAVATIIGRLLLPAVVIGRRAALRAVGTRNQG